MAENRKKEPEAGINPKAKGVHHGESEKSEDPEEGEATNDKGGAEPHSRWSRRGPGQP